MFSVKSNHINSGGKVVFSQYSTLVLFLGDNREKRNRSRFVCCGWNGDVFIRLKEKNKRLQNPLCL